MKERSPILSFTDVHYRFNDGAYGLKGVSLGFYPGEILLIAGANGAGKTLLMRHANGLVRPESGKILYKGYPLKKNLKEVRQRIGMVFQHPEDQFIEDTVYGELRFGLDNIKLPQKIIKLRTDSILENFGLAPLRDRHPLTLSGGERRRLALASVIAMEPEYLILDEPFMELDYPGIKDLLSILVTLHKGGLGMCIVTHDVGKILAHSDRLVIMKEGRVVSAGPSESQVQFLETNGVRNPCGGGVPFEKSSWL